MIDSILCQLGHVASWEVLEARGVSRRSVMAAVNGGRIIRPRHGIYACAHIDETTRRAAQVGGAVSCVSALAEAGVWTGHERRLHVHVPAHGSMTAPPGTVLHWERARFGDPGRWQVSRMQALWQAITCLDEEHAIAAMESAVHEGYLSEAEVRKLAALVPRRLIAGARELDFRSQSGNETVVRLRLRAAGYRVEPQAPVPGVGHGDLLIEDCVSLDVDGRRWHEGDRFAIDRDRDIRVEGFGRRALRIWAGQIYESWPTTLAVIDRAVTDARREMRRRRGRILIPFDAPID